MGKTTNTSVAHMQAQNTANINRILASSFYLSKGLFTTSHAAGLLDCSSEQAMRILKKMQSDGLVNQWKDGDKTSWTARSRAFIEMRKYKYVGDNGQRIGMHYA